jgi:membrane protease YdiL (CAAX protease family)
LSKRRPSIGRPEAVLLAVWAGSLVALAAVAPAAQTALGVPYELLSLVMLAPALASLVVVVRPGWITSWWARISTIRVLMISAGAIIVALAFVASLSLLTGRTPSWSAPGFGSPLWAFLILQTAGVFGEEIGWRGVVQRAGERFARPAVVSAIAGFLFGATHLGYWSLGPVPVVTFALTAALMSLAITTLYEGTVWQRMLPAVIIHLGVNLTIASLAEAGEPLATTPAALLSAALMLVVAILFKLILRRRNAPRHWSIERPNTENRTHHADAR